MRSTKSFVLALALLVPLTLLSATPAKAGASVSLSFFYDSLAPYGNWYASANYGYVWRPAHVSVDWRPYTDGRWVYSDVGWTFAAYDSWGWGPYHYGRWYYDPLYGWVWVPGTEWAPAWVSFYEGPGWIGWAPLPPRLSLSVGFASSIRVDPRAYCFVESRYFLDPYVGRRLQPFSRNVTLLRSVRDVNRFDRVRGTFVNRGLAVDRIERVTHSRVKVFRFEGSEDSRMTRTAFRGDSMTVFRPRIDSRAEHAPRVVSNQSTGRPARMDAKVEHPAPSVHNSETRLPPGRSEMRSPVGRPDSRGTTIRKSVTPTRKAPSHAAPPPPRSMQMSDRRSSSSDHQYVSSRSTSHAPTYTPSRGSSRHVAPVTHGTSGSDPRSHSVSIEKQQQEKAGGAQAAPSTKKRSTYTAKDRRGKPTSSHSSSDHKPPHRG